jgi:hypothetical protein
MTAVGDTKSKIRAIVAGGGGNLRGKNKSITSIYGSMLLKSGMRDVILDRPVGFYTPGKLQEVAVFVQASRSGFSFLLRI